MINDIMINLELIFFLSILYHVSLRAPSILREEPCFIIAEGVVHVDPSQDCKTVMTLQFNMNHVEKWY